FILITLILILELTDRVEKATQATHDTDQIEQNIELLSSEVQRLNLIYENHQQSESESVEVNAFNRTEKQDELQANVAAARERLQAMQQRQSGMQNAVKSAQADRVALLQKAKELESQRKSTLQFEDLAEVVNRKATQLSEFDGPLYRERTERGRLVAIVDLVDQTIRLNDAATKSSRVFEGGARLSNFRQWLTPGRSSDRHFLLLVHPSGASDFNEVREVLSNRGCTFGFDVVGEAYEPQLSYQWGQE
ncbi:MAG: hypothetical protein WBD31_28570, partial [Rubripirellula sp.]